jgi:molybdopterin-guanine dinucleotide biosynthesis protein A
MRSKAYAAIVLAGGRAARLGGTDKSAIRLGGRSLLAHALDAVGGAADVVVVGPAAVTDRPVTFVREDPAYGGPVAGLLAGRDALTYDAERLVVLAVDMPHLTSDTVRRLLAACEDHDGAVLVDASGRRQLAFAVATDRLDAVRPADDRAHGAAVRELLEPLDLAAVPAQDDEHRDIDTPADLRDLRDLAP